jgi:carbon monoxide dehydrogenase subunit G
VQLENTFTVPVPVERAWAVLLDIERVAPCMPGATLTSADGDEFAGTVRVKLGPVSMTFKGSGRFVERDEAAHRVVISASGADSRGGGTARATVTALLVAADGGTEVKVVTDLDITGKAAQFGRGLIGDVSGRLIGQFATCLATQLASAEPIAPVEPDAEPIDLVSVSGVGLAVRRAVPYMVTAAASFAVVLGIIWWIKRR